MLIDDIEKSLKMLWLKLEKKIFLVNLFGCMFS